MKARIGSLDVQYEVSGSGPWLTLSHSIATDLRLWQPQMDALAARFTVLRYDIRGHGGSSVPPGASPTWTLSDLAADAAGLLAHLGIRRTHWLGLSLGGMVGQTLALEHPALLDHVVLAHTTARGLPAAPRMWAQRAALAREQGMSAVVAPTLERWFTPGFAGSGQQAGAQAQAQAKLERIAGMIRATSVPGYAGCCEAIAGLDTLDRLPGLHQPALVIAGAQDQAATPDMARALAAAWPGARLCMLEGAAHLGNVEQADAFNAAVLDFLAPARA